MKIKHILSGIIVIASFAFNLNAGVMETKFYPRKFTVAPGDDMRKQLGQNKSVRQAFCEALTNTVVRTLTVGLRKNNDSSAENKTVSWQADRKTFSFKYKAQIKYGVIVREECVLKAFRMPVLRTLNGKMLKSPDLSKRQLSRILYYLKKGNIEIKKVDISVDKDRDIAENLLEYLDIEDKSNIYIRGRLGEPSLPVKIILK